MSYLLEFNGKRYPALQSEGFAAQYAFPFATKICIGTGYDIGCNREEWKLPNAIGIDPNLPECRYDAYNLPAMKVDFVFSSHCAEHLENWSKAILYWQTKLHDGGILFLYLPSPEQSYWRSWHNKKHIHNLSPELIEEFLNDTGWKDIFVTKGYDVNHSFTAIAVK